MPASAADLGDPDPVKASYDVYIKPQSKDGSALYILQFPNRTSTNTYARSTSSLPTELRLKPKTGLLEIDVPVDPWRNYDREKGARWGEAMSKTAGGKSSSYGLPGGFGIGAPSGPRNRGARENDFEDVDMQEDITRDFNQAVTQQRVLLKQTLGGQAIPKEKMSPQYMIGAFKKNELHLTPVSQIVQMRPQFHHLDAAADLERSSRPREPTAAPTGAPRAIHMTMKSTIDGEEDTTDTMAERVRAAQEEQWKRLRYVDEDSASAWQKYSEMLFVDTETEEGVLKAAPKLESTMGQEEYLDAISAPRDVARLSRSRMEKKNGKHEEDDEDDESDGPEEVDGPG